MGALRRGTKNAFRNSIRAIAIVVILGLSIALALVMLLSMKAVDSRITQVKSDIGNTITVRAAGFRGFEGGGDPLTNAQVDTIARIPHVTAAVPTLSDRLRNVNSTGFGPGDRGPGGATTSTVSRTTTLTSPISPGSLGQRFGNDQGATTQTLPANFSLPVTFTGTTNPADPRVLGVDSIDLLAGRSFTRTSTDAVALVGTDLAAKNSLNLGSTFTAWGTAVTVIGVYETGDTFADGGVVMPFLTVETLSGQTGPTTVLVTVDSVDELTTVTNAITKVLGTSADVTSDATTSATTLDSLENIKTISSYSLVGALAAGAVITFLLMLMIVRERRREIGVLKAVGAGNGRITLQYVAEALTFTLLASVVGILFGILLANPVLDVLVKNENGSTTASSQTATFGPPGGFPGGPPGQGTQGQSQGQGRTGTGQFPGGPPGRVDFGRGFQNTFTDAGGTLDNLKAAVGFDTVLYGVLAALGIAVLGSAIPAYSISRVRPAEVMRSE